MTIVITTIMANTMQPYRERMHDLAWILLLGCVSVYRRLLLLFALLWIRRKKVDLLLLLPLLVVVVVIIVCVLVGTNSIARGTSFAMR